MEKMKTAVQFPILHKQLYTDCKKCDSSAYLNEALLTAKYKYSSQTVMLRID